MRWKYIYPLIFAGIMLISIYSNSCKNEQNFVLISPTGWKVAMDSLGIQVGSTDFSRYTGDSVEFSLDFFVNDNKNYYTAIFSARNDTFGIVESFVGSYKYEQLFYAKIDTTLFLQGDFEKHYDSLLEKDSCWLIHGSIPYWEIGLKRLWEREIILFGDSKTKGFRGILMNAHQDSI